MWHASHRFPTPGPGCHKACITVYIETLQCRQTSYIQIDSLFQPKAVITRSLNYGQIQTSGLMQDQRSVWSTSLINKTRETININEANCDFNIILIFNIIHRENGPNNHIQIKYCNISTNISKYIHKYTIIRYKYIQINALHYKHIFVYIQKVH